MKKTQKLLYQWCIKETYVSEVGKLPEELSIESITFEIGFSLKRVVTTIPQSLRALGVVSLREPSTSMEAKGTLQGSRAQIMKSAREICKELNLDFRHMRVRRMVVAHKGTTAIFTRMTKHMDTGENNKTYALKVLGLVSHNGDDKGLDKIISLLTAKKVNCSFTSKLITTVVCSE